VSKRSGLEKLATEHAESAKMNVQYIPVQEKDSSFFVHVHHVAYRKIIEEMFGWDECFQDKQTNQAFDLGGINVIKLQNEKVGIVGWEDRSDYLWLKDLYVLPEYQGRGIGSRVLDTSIQKARSFGKDIHLRTLRANICVKEWYERRGFIVDEITDIHWKMVMYT